MREGRAGNRADGGSARGAARPRKVALGAAALLVAAAVAPASAAAHGLVQRADLPIPEWLFGWAAAVVLVVSFLALAILWPKPKLEGDDWRPLRGGIARALASRPLEVVCGAIGVVLFGIVIWSGLVGEQAPTANLAPTFVYVIFWVGFVPASVLFGDVFRAFNPWRAIGRAAGWLTPRPGDPGPRRPYPEALGRWPAVAGLLAFTWLELAATHGDRPRNLAISALVYSAATFAGMWRYGVEPWTDRAETFSVYFNLFSRVSPFESRDGQIGLRRPLSGLTRLEGLPGTVPLLAVMIGSVTFDGLSEGPFWGGIAPDIASSLESVGIGPERAAELTQTVGLLAAVVLVYAFYRAGVAGARRVQPNLEGERLRRSFIHSLVPIALVYVAAHYVTLLVFEGQAIAYLASDPLGRGWDLFGTAKQAIDYGVLGQETTWYLQVGFVVAGHVAALTLAHDRALIVYEHAKRAVRSQYWMLGIMIGFTTLALWLLSQANA